MTQYVINIGTLPNDGTGDPLRTAFNEVNLNFDQIFAAGPVLSNIQIANNTILTTNTNGNLILAPNGIGVVQANVNIVPNTSNIRNLGSATRRWSELYVQYANVTGNLDIGGQLVVNDLTVEGNLTVVGNTIQIGNLVTDAKTLQLANTAGTANAANGSGITVGANDQIATFLFNSAQNSWTTNIAISAAGNVSGFNLLATGTISATGNITGGNLRTTGTISTTGNITGNFVAPGGNGQVMYNRNGVIGASPTNFNFDESTQTLFVKVGDFTGNADGTDALYVGAPGFTFLGSDIMVQATGNVPSYSQVNFQNINPSPLASGDYIITADNGTDSTHFIDLGITSSTWDGSEVNGLGNAVGADSGYLYVQDGNLAIGTRTGNTVHVWTFTDTGNLLATGNIIPAANAAYSLGNSTNWWSNVWVAGNTIYIGGVPLGMSAGNVLTVNGNAVLQNDSNTTISTTGNITADYFFGNGSQLTGLATSSISNGTSNVDIANVNGPVTINVNGTETWEFDDAGNLTLPTNGGIVVDGVDGYIGPVSDDLVISWDNEEIRLVSVQGSIEMQADNAFRVQTNYDGGNDLYAGRWEFSNNELVNISNNFGIVSEAGNLTLSGGRDGVNSGNTIISAVDLGNAVVNWTFGNNGVLFLPNGGEIDNDGNNIELRSNNNINLEAFSVVNVYTDNGDFEFQFGDDGGFYVPNNGALVGVTANNNGYINWVGNSSGDGNGFTTMQLVPDGTVNSQVLVLDPTAPGHIHLRAPGIGGNIEQPAANIFLGPEDTNFEITAQYGNAAEARIHSAGNTWTFANDGNLNLPSQGNIVGITANNAGHLQWLGNSSGDGAGYTTLQLVPDNTLTGGDQYVIIDPTAPGHIHIRAGGTQDASSADLFLGGENSHFKVAAGANSDVVVRSNSNNWTFDTLGVLTLPGEGVLRSIGDTVTLQSINVGSGNANSVYLGSSGGLGFYDQEIGGNWLEIFRSGAEPEIRVPVGRGNLNIQTAEGNTAYNWSFDNTGNLTAPGNISTTGNITADYFIGNGSLLTGLPVQYTDANVTALLSNLGANAIASTANITTTANISATGNITGNFVTGRINAANPTGGAGAIALDMNNQTIGSVNNIQVSDSGPNEGIEWLEGANWSIFDSPNDFTNTTGNLQIVSGNISNAANTAAYTRVTFNTVGQVEIPVAAGTAPLLINSTTQVANLNASLLAGFAANSANSANTVVIRTTSGDVVANNIGNITSINLDGNANTVLYGNGVFAPAPAGYSDVNVATFLAAFGSNTISTTGNITAGNIIGNISITGNVTGTSANVTLVAGNFSTVFDNIGQATFPGPVICVANSLANLTAVSGARAFVNDANLVAAGNFGAQISGGGSNTVPVWSDGANWYIG